MLTIDHFPSAANGSGRAHYAFTDRQGGISLPPWDQCNLSGDQGDDPAAVAANRQGVARQLGVDHLVFMRQVHGDTVCRVDAPEGEDVADCDALVTTLSRVGLAVMVADCVPVLLADPGAGVVAAVHAGRRGVQARIVLRALEHMEQLGASRGTVQARLGPAICGSCYELPQQMVDQVAALAPQAVTTTSVGTPGVDLRQALIATLTEAGVKHVSTVGGCTNEQETLFSYRRAQRQGRPSGRMAGVVWLDNR